jgi:N-acyl-D-aspartate/D-glutamate deacylase
MTAMVDQALAQGACGASSGLEYTPGAFAARDELFALCRPLAGRGLVYATHMRTEDDRLLEAIEEAIAVAGGAGSTRPWR